MTNLANFFFGLGAFFTPLVVAVMLQRAGFSPAMYVLAAFVTLSAVLVMCVDFGALYPVMPKVADQRAAPGVGVLLGDPIMWLAAMAMFFFAPVEVGVSTWITTYLGENRVSEKAAAVVLSAFWLVYTFARLTNAFVLPVGGERVFIVVAGPGVDCHPRDHGFRPQPQPGDRDGRPGGDRLRADLPDDHRRACWAISSRRCTAARSACSSPSAASAGRSSPWPSAPTPSERASSAVSSWPCSRPSG